MEFKEIKKLIELLQESDVTELQLEKEGEKVKIKREKYHATVEAAPAAVSFVPKAEEKKDPAVPELKGNTISSPIVGIFHRAPSPESPPFVEIGSAVKKGQVLCIVEAMKLMNEIESDTDGTISKIFIENGQPVEYGEPLFLIDPS